jgi:hypothetical protein
VKSHSFSKKISNKNAITPLLCIFIFNDVGSG